MSATTAHLLGPVGLGQPAAGAAPFSPRAEFRREQHTFSTFAILALSGTGAVRLYSFPPPLVSALRQYLHNAKLTVVFKEDVENAICELVIEGRPWSMARSCSSEKLLVDLLAVIFRFGFIFLSTIDYAREQDDRLAIAFSRPLATGQEGSRPGSPVPGVSAGVPVAPPRTIRVPFAISFLSATVLRVINPPLNSTPAILQAVRGAWPRGIVAEKKIADTCFEFKLKGYRWFQEDTFAQDSLQHMLALMAALDAHGFRLLSSMTLANRSRIKDFWVFTGSATDVPCGEFLDSLPVSTSSLELRAQESPDGSRSSGSHAHARHMRTASGGTPAGGVGTTAASPLAAAVPLNHVRNMSESSTARSQNGAARALLRKTPPPKPVAGTSALRQSVLAAQEEEEPFRTSLPSDVGSAVNMTGVGTGRVRIVEAPRPPPLPARSMPGASPMYEEDEDEEADDAMENDRDHDGEVIYATGGGADNSDARSVATSIPLTQIMHEDDPFRREIPAPRPRPPLPGVTPPAPLDDEPAMPGAMYADAPPRAIPADQPRTPSPYSGRASELLGGAFRDTAFSAGSGWRATGAGMGGVEVPVTWFEARSRDSAPVVARDSGVALSADSPRERAHSAAAPRASPPYRASAMTPRVPGAWVATPAAGLGAAGERGSGGTTPRGGPGGFPHGAAADPASYFADTDARWAFPAPHALAPEHALYAADAHMPVVAEAHVRQSEAGIVGLMPAPPLPPRPAPAQSAAPASAPPPLPPRRAGTPPRSGDGWVLVDVDARLSRPPNRPRSTSDSFVPRVGVDAPEPVRPQTPPHDASRASLSSKESSRVRRFFSLSKDSSVDDGRSPRKARKQRGAAGAPPGSAFR